MKQSGSQEKMKVNLAWVCLYVAIAFPYSQALMDVAKLIFGNGLASAAAMVFAVTSVMTAIDIIRTRVEHE